MRCQMMSRVLVVGSSIQAALIASSKSAKHIRFLVNSRTFMKALLGAFFIDQKPSADNAGKDARGL